MRLNLVFMYVGICFCCTLVFLMVARCGHFAFSCFLPSLCKREIGKSRNLESEIEKLRNREIGKSRNKEIEKSGNREIEKAKTRKHESKNAKTGNEVLDFAFLLSRFPDFPISRFPDFSKSRFCFLDFSISKFLDFSIS